MSAPVIDMRTRLPHGHIANHAADMKFIAKRLAECAAQLRALQSKLEAMDVQAVVAELEAAPAARTGS